MDPMTQHSANVIPASRFCPRSASRASGGCSPRGRSWSAAARWGPCRRHCLSAPASAKSCSSTAITWKRATCSASGCRGSDVERAMPKAAARGGAPAQSEFIVPNSHAEVKDMTPQNAAALLTPADAILDGADNLRPAICSTTWPSRQKRLDLRSGRRHARFADAGRAGGNGLPVVHLPASSALAATDVRNVRGAQRPQLRRSLRCRSAKR